MAEILPIRRKTLSNQLINQSLTEAHRILAYGYITIFYVIKLYITYLYHYKNYIFPTYIITSFRSWPFCFLRGLYHQLVSHINKVYEKAFKSFNLLRNRSGGAVAKSSIIGCSNPSRDRRKVAKKQVVTAPLLNARQ